MLLFLVGYMGCGKSSIGRPLAKRLGMQFVDMDTEIERRCGMSVRDFFAAHGEQEFRRYEHEVLQELTKAENTVVATGGVNDLCFEVKVRKSWLPLFERIWNSANRFTLRLG